MNIYKKKSFVMYCVSTYIAIKEKPTIQKRENW